MNEVIDFNKEVTIDQTSMRGEREVLPNIEHYIENEKFLSNKSIGRYNHSNIVDKSAEDKLESSNNIIIKEMTDEDVQWFYATKYNSDGNIYSIDKEGNLIAKLDLSVYGQLTQTDGKTISDNDIPKIKNALNQCREQINFKKEQEKLQEEIKGYPELNETVCKVFKPVNALLRFKTIKNQLRAILDGKDDDILRIMFSIVWLNKKENFVELFETGVITLEMLDKQSCNPKNKLTKYIYDYVQKYGTLPTIQNAFNVIDLPYSEEFCKEYLYDDVLLNEKFEIMYSNLRKKQYQILANRLTNCTEPVENIMNELQNLLPISKPTVFEDNFDELEEYLENKEDEITLSTGIEALDIEDFQLSKGKICSVFAYTGSFKTMFCTNVTYNNIAKGANVLYVSLEISKMEMYINLLSRHSYQFENKLSHTDIKKANITKEDKEYLLNTIHPDFKEKFKKHLIVYDETDIKSNTYEVFDKLFVNADNEFIKRTGSGIDILVIDHVNLLKFGGNLRGQNDYSAVNHWMSYFRKNCLDFVGKKKPISILCAAQSSREGYKKALKEGKYDLTSIAEGNEIERSSQLVLSIFTNKEDRNNNRTKIQILKSRDDKSNEEMISIDLEPKYYAFGIKSKNSRSNNEQANNINIQGNSKETMDMFRSKENEE